VNIDGTNRPGDFVTARIDRAHPHHLSGRLVDETVPA
jgi:hypothetical protein